MKTASISELKDGLSSYLESVRMGHSVLVTDRRRPIALLHRVDEKSLSKAGWNLVRQSLAHPPVRRLVVKDFLALPKAVGSAPLSPAILEDREER
ncbi:MAG: type II toxin-antitoxin system Phd/YefM family antitoxin [Terrimicrobiaceae bacterium]